EPREMTSPLQGKTALITGSTQGLGLAAAKQFAAAGCDVVLNGFSDVKTLDAIRKDIESRFGVRTAYSGADLRKPESIAGMMFTPVDILVNNAVVRHTAPIEDFDVD